MNTRTRRRGHFLPHPDPIRGSESYPDPAVGPVVTIGNFDGVHRGHRVLLEQAIARARGAGVPSCAYTFFPAPRDVLRPDNRIPRIQTLDDRLACLFEAGIDQVVIEPFTREFGAQSAQWFATEVLGRRLGASAVVVGWDFRFGKGRAGSVDQLRDHLEVEIEQVAAYAPDGIVISSSRIREATRAGDVGLAAELLGRPHQIVGTVVPGDARGRTLGFPTANIAPETELIPADGVYAVWLDGSGLTQQPGVANIGSRPTFDSDGRSIEVHVLDFAGDLYGEQVRLHWVERLRSEQRFDDVDALIHQIGLDVRSARAVLDTAEVVP